MEYTLSKVAKDDIPGGAVDSLEGKEALQKDLDRLVSWAITSHMKLNRTKCRILHLRQSRSGCMYNLGYRRLESSSTERDLGVWIGDKLNMSQQCALAAIKAKRVLWCIKHSIASWLREVIVSLVWPYLKPCVEFCAPQYKKDIKLLECVQRRVARMVQVLEGKTSEDRLRLLC